MVRAILSITISLHAATASLASAQDGITTRLAPRQISTTENVGPWGRLESYQIPLTCPDSYIPLLTLPSQQTEWIFEVRTKEALTDMLAESGLTAEQIASLQDGSTSMEDGENVRIFPENETILSMSTALRMKLYAVLARSPQNRFHHRPVYINTDNISRWFQGSEVPRSVLQDIATLVYPTPSGHGYFLSDIPYLLESTASTEHERILMRALLRRQSLIVRLKLEPQTNLQSLANYWSAGFEHKEILPLMESITRTPGVDRLEVAHLLPGTARKNLNTYPTQADGLDGRYPDWFWTCYNFFRFVPRDVYAESEERDEILANEFVQSTPPHRFGDLILLKSGGETIHGCIYVGADIVYTKNEAGLFSPWVLTKLPDVVAYHDMKGDVTLSVFRLRPRL